MVNRKMNARYYFTVEGETEGHAVALRFAREDDVEYVFDEDASWIEVED